jgi:hypothetical protein
VIGEKLLLGGFCFCCHAEPHFGARASSPDKPPAVAGG